MIHKLFYSIIFGAWLLFVATTSGYSADVPPKQVDNCHVGCGHENAPGRGTGISVCWVTFVAPLGADELQVQLFARGEGILKNAKGEIAIRGGAKGTARVSVDCSAIRRADRVIGCYVLKGEQKQHRIDGEDYEKKILPLGREGRRGAAEYQL